MAVLVVLPEGYPQVPLDTNTSNDNHATHGLGNKATTDTTHYARWHQQGSIPSININFTNNATRNKSNELMILTSKSVGSRQE
jgi:hypothetical protein